MSGGFFERLQARIDTADSVLSVGLDTAVDRIPEQLQGEELPQWAFNRRIIDATHEYAACYKPNLAFYESPAGWRALRETIAYAEGKGVPVLLDGKRADIGNTARQYATLLEEADAITVNPYLGRDAVEPFLQQAEKGVFVLCRTSNPGGSEFQNLQVGNDKRLFEYVAQRAAAWNESDNVGLVVGATAPDELEQVRELVPELPFLVPGVGSQGGDVAAAIDFGLTAEGVGLINSSRGIIYAGADEQFEAAAATAAKRLTRRLNEHRRGGEQS